MKICVIMLAKKFGGAERFYVDLTNGLARRGHDMLAISHARSKAALHLEQLPNVNQAPVRVLGPWDPLAPRTILKLVRDFKPDIIQTSLSRAAHLAGPAARRLNIPLVAHTHDFVDLKYFRNVDVFTPATAAQRDYLLNEGIPADGVRRIPNFSSLSAVTAIRCRDEVTKIVALGRFVYKKGFDLLLRSFSHVANGNIRLYLAGEGAERQRLMNLATALNIDNKVHFAGWQDDVRSFLLQGDLFVLPSRYEPFGIAVLEAMACGVPIVATKCHGPVEILDTGSAWLCDADEDALTHALITAISDPDGRQRRAHTAWTLFQERYAADKVIPKFERLYEDIRAGKGTDFKHAPACCKRGSVPA